MEDLVMDWFRKWEQGDFSDLPLAEDFTHTSPFGKITGKEPYLDTVRANRDKFLGYEFVIRDAIYMEDRACVRYTAKQGEDFTLDVSEWYYAEKDRIKEIIAYYHIGDIRDERKLIE